MSGESSTMWWWIALALITGIAIGAAVVWLAVRRRFHEIRQTEQRARRAERLAEIGSMTGGLAHEIKNPLSTISLNAQLISEQISDIQGQDELKSRLANRTGALRRETDRLRGILQDFLQYAGQVRLERAPTDLAVLCQDLIDFLSPEADRLGISLRYDGPVVEQAGANAAERLVAPVDQRLLKQALLNLLLNAMGALGPKPAAEMQTDQAQPSPRERAIIVRLRHEKPQGKGVVRLGKARGARPAGQAPNRDWLDEQGECAAIHVIDTGPGMSSEVLARIFQPYYTTKAGGTGLGLPTSRRYIEEHGGTLSVSSQAGMGSDFVVRLPLRVDALPSTL
jgi:signal transduction histidine kinase